jgi:hypothetical protein
MCGILFRLLSNGICFVSEKEEIFVIRINFNRLLSKSLAVEFAIDDRGGIFIF